MPQSICHIQPPGEGQSLSSLLYYYILINPTTGMILIATVAIIVFSQQCFGKKAKSNQKIHSTLEEMKQQYAQRIHCSQRQGESEAIRLRKQMMADIDQENIKLKELEEDEKSMMIRSKNELEERKFRAKNRAHLNDYLSLNRQPKKELKRTIGSHVQRVEKITGSAAMQKLKDTVISRKRYVEDGPQQAQKPQEPPKTAERKKTIEINIAQVDDAPSELESKNTGTFNFPNQAGSLFGNNNNIAPKEVQTLEKKVPALQTQPMFGGQQNNLNNLLGSGGNRGDSLFGNLNMNKSKEETNLFGQPKPPASIIDSQPNNPPSGNSGEAIQKPLFKISEKKEPESVPQKPPNVPSVPPPSSVQPAPSFQPAPRQPSQKLTSEQFLESYIKFVENMKEEEAITSKIENISGARSSPAQTLAEIKALLNTIDKANDKQITTFGLKLFETILYKFINNSNVKSGLSRIPPKSRTEQCEKNAINCYVLACNMMRLMPNCKKIWAIVFGKTLKMLDFLYKRKTDLESFHKLELIQCGYVKEYKQIHSKYISRIDFLIYFLLGLTSFDPLLLMKNLEVKDPKLQTERKEIQDWGNTWSYSQFWCLMQVIFGNTHESYFKPIFYMNLLYVLYPRIYEYKKSQGQKYKQEYTLFTRTIEKAKKYLSGLEKMKELVTLSECDQNERMNYVYDGDDFVDSIKLLSNRITEKDRELKVRTPQEYEQKANIFYYFTKER